MKAVFQTRRTRLSHRPRARRTDLAAACVAAERLEQRQMLAADGLRSLLEPASTLVMDPSMVGPNPVVMSKAQVVGADVTSFVISHVPDGSVVEKWNQAQQQWVDVSTMPTSSNPQELMRLLSNRYIRQGDIIQWRSEVGVGAAAQAAFQMIGWDDGSELPGVSEEAPGVVENLVVAPTGAGELTLTWDPPATGDATLYSIRMTASSGNESSLNVYATSSTTYTLRDLSPGNGYLFSVTASNSQGVSPSTQDSYGQAPLQATNNPSLITVMLDSSSGETVELMASHLLGQGSQGFVVTKVHGGTLEKWVPAQNAWKPMTAGAYWGAIEKASTVRVNSFTDTVRWTPDSGTQGLGAAFDIVSLDKAGGATAPIPQAGTVPGRLVNASIDYTDGVGTGITWAAPTDGCGCASTRYSIEISRDGQTLLYNVPSDIGELAEIAGGQVTSARLWGATKAGAGVPRTYDWFLEQRIKNRLAYTISTNFSAMPLRREARVQLAGSPTPVNGTQTSFVLGGSNASLAHVEVSAVPDVVEAAEGLPAETRPIVSTESNKLTAAGKAVLERNPILARSLFPGTVNGEVQPDHARVHFQAGEKLRIAGNVDMSVASRATIVVEEAPILVNNSLGHWYSKARLPAAADGSFAYDHDVQYGMTAVRVRLEVAAAVPVGDPTMSLGATAPDQTVPQWPISLDYNAFGITTAPWQVANHQGFDRSGNYYNSNYTGGDTKDTVYGTPITYNGISFPLGQIPSDKSQVGGSSGPSNFVQAKGQTITVDIDAEQHDYLYLAGAAANGDQLSQQITLTFTDGTTETWTQSFTDWSNSGSSAVPQPFSGEFLIETQPERINQQGNLEPTPAYVFAYGYNLQGKQLASITLPNNENVGILSAVVAQSAAIQTGEVESQVLGHMNLTGVDLLQVTIKNESNIGAGGGPLTFFLADNPETTATASTPAVYTQKQVTVPMGQQRIVTYVGPDSSSQLNFTVQKADGTCVGPNCSTYLPDWNSGSGHSDKRAANISPSLNSQVTSGQSWTLTIQNAGFGYYGYLDSPAGQNLPDPSGKTPGGAQFQLMTEAEIKSQPEWARQLEYDIGLVVGIAIITVATGGTGDVAIVGAEVAEDATAEVTAEAGVAGGVVDGGGQVVAEDLLTDSFMQEVYGAGEGAVSFGDSFSAIAEEELELDGSLISVDGLGADVEVWVEGDWINFEGEVAVDVDAFEEPFIFEVDDVEYAGWRAGFAADAEADAERAAQRAIQDAFRNLGFR
jgi:hypothetical protein